MTYLERHTKNQGYWFRRGIPAALRPVLQKGTVWRENLHTKERNEARLRAHAIAAQVEAAFQRARSMLSGTANHGLGVTEPDPAFLVGLLSAWKEQERYRRACVVLAEPPSDDAFAAECRLAGACGTEIKGFTPEADDNMEAVYAGLNALLRTSGVSLTPKHPAFHMLAQRFSELWVEVLEEERRWRNFDLVTLPAAKPAPISAVCPPEVSRDNLRLMEVHARYVTERRLSPSVQREHQTAFRRLREVVGGDIPIRAITKAHVVDLKTLMFLTPKRPRRSEAGLPLPHLVAAYKGQGCETVDQGTVVKTMGLVHAFFGWAHENGYTQENLATKTVPRKKGRAHNNRNKDRRSYTPDDIRVLFGSPLFTGCLSTRRAYRAGPCQVRDHRYWLPILALHTGCRLEELGQLQRADVKERGGIWYLDVTTITEAEDAPSKSLKTGRSHRIVPLHPTVLRLGFIAYVQGLEEPSSQVFPNLRPTSDGRLTQSYSKVFGRYCDHIGLTDPRTVFHSFRHTFKDQCRSAGVMEEVHDALTGHTFGGEGRRYGSGVPFDVLYSAISKLTFEQFPL